jgi:adenylate cyclase, class 2
MPLWQDSLPMARNLEIKAHCPDLSRAAAVAAAAGGSFRGTLDQVDTYFHARAGRLKLRESVLIAPDGGRSEQVELIAYLRPDQGGSRESSYSVIPLAEASGCLAGLSAVLGVRSVVRKRRGLWIVGATRIHLDEVAGLGSFIELETVITDQPELAAQVEHERLIERLAIDAAETLAGSYGELIEASSSAR